jgi:carboxylesterase
MLAGAVKFSEAPPFGVKNKRMRRIVEDVLQRKGSLHYAWVPLIAIRELDKLREMAKRNLERVTCPTLIIHSLDDELTSVRSASFLRDGINGNRDTAKAHIRFLSDSFHMVCIDNERDDVVRHVRAFLAS